MTVQRVITRDDLRDLLGRRSNTGVLSIFIDGGNPGRSPGWQISHLRSGLKQLVHSRAGDRQGRELEAAAKEAFEEISGMPSGVRGRSLAYFRDSEGDFVWWRSLRGSVSSNFTWMDAPFLRPLVAYLDDSPCLGVIVLAKDAARLMTWRQGVIDPDTVLALSPSTSTEGMGRFPRRGPNRGPNTVAPGDHLRSRVSHQMRRFAGEIASAVPKMAVQESWEKLVVIGGSPLREELQGHLVQPWKGLVIGSLDKFMTHASPGDISAALQPALTEWNRDREQRELEETVNLANGGGRAAVGAGRCLELLQEARVSHLYFPADLKLRGLRRADGSLALQNSSDGNHGTEEPYLVERMVEVALETGADVTPVEGKPAQQLHELGGVAARLRY